MLSGERELWPGIPKNAHVVFSPALATQPSSFNDAVIVCHV